ncbi:endoglucanase c [Fusarium agapanthi]|uniref:Endoglucanase c n=1 Tax=Fusarium agapanthi TaxID=1803897 RepID=A0A9P5B7E8_9HYPO|nr:endoglucanase c [Fusarium agapanthi]
MRTAAFITLLASVVSATPFGQRSQVLASASETCPVVFDGRVPANASLTDFDTANGGGWNPYNPGFVKGNNISWSEILQLPKTKTKSRFDTEAGTIPLEVTISDKSIFMKQLGFRRAGLQLNKDSNEGSPGSEGVKTLHFSIMQDHKRPLNLSHEYLNVWHEKADFSGNQFQFQAGQLIGQNGTAATWKLLDQDFKLLWETPMLKKVWQNFAITLNYEKNTIQAYYSKGCKPLKAATQPIARNLTGQGQFQIGILKKPTGTDDVANSGFQEANLNEGLIYGGLFLEDSADGCVSL